MNSIVALKLFLSSERVLAAVLHSVKSFFKILTTSDFIWVFQTLAKVFKVLFDYVVAPITDVSSRNPTKLDNFQEFMIVLAKLRLDSSLQEFAYKFDISMAIASIKKLFKWITTLVSRSRLFPFLLS